MDLHLHLREDQGLADQIFEQLQERIRTGTLPTGASLPSSRELARRLAISRTTVMAAYERLTAHGLIRSRTGAGTYVTAPGRQTGPPPATASPLRARAVWSTPQLAVPERTRTAVSYDFAPGIPSDDGFPFARWRALLSDQLRNRAAGVDYVDPAGSRRLRTALAQHLAVSRDVRVAPEQLMITSGAQQAFDIATRLLLEPGDLVAVEDPGYLPACRAFLAHGARVAGVPVDREGLVVDQLPDHARLVYVTPSHQFPLGMPMSAARRAALLAWADRHDAAIIEDDYDSEFRFTGRPLTPLHAIDTSGRVLYVGSFSKTLLPTLRVGFLAVPKQLAEPARRAKFAADYGTAAQLQQALASFIESGDLARHIRRMRRTYERRHHLVISLLRERFADLLDPIEASGGTHLAALLARPEPADTAIVERAATAGVQVGTVSRWSIEQPALNGLVFGYGGVATDKISDGVLALRRAVDNLF